MKIVGIGVLVVLAVYAPMCAGQFTAGPSATPEQQAQVARAQQLVTRMDELYKAGNFKEAIAVAQDFLPVARKLTGERSTATAFALHQLAYFNFVIGNLAEAKEADEQALAIRREVLGNKHQHTALSLRNLSDVLFGLNEYDKAIEYRQESLEIYLAINERSIEVADLLHRVAQSQQQKKNHVASLGNYERAIAIRKELLGDQHPDLAQSLQSLGNLLVEMGRYAEGRRYLEQALSIDLAAFGEKNLTTEGVLVNLGVACESLNDYSAARSCFQRALAVRKEVADANDPNVCYLYGRLGQVLAIEGDYASARPYLVQAAEGYRRTYGDRNPNTIPLLAAIGNMDVRLGDYSSARAEFEKTVAIGSKAFGENDPTTLVARIPLAALMGSLGNVEEAKAQFRQALAIARKSLPEEHADTAYLYHELGGFLKDTGRLAEAQKFLERALAIRKKLLGESHSRTSNTLDSLAVVCTQLHDFQAAKSYFEQSLKIRQTTMPEKHPDVAHAWKNLGYVAAISGEVDKAIDHTKRALEIERGLNAFDDSDLAITLSNLAVFSTLRSDLQAAARYADESRRRARRHAVGVLPSLSEAEQLAYLSGKESYLSFVAYSVAAYGRKDPQIAALSAGWLINGKSIVQEEMAERAMLMRESCDPKTRELAQRLIALRARQARAMNTAARSEASQKFREERTRLAKEQESLSRQLSQASARSPRTQSWIELNEVRSKLAPGEVLIDIARFRWFDFSKSLMGEVGVDHYFAWIIPPSGDVRIVDLGDAQQIDDAVNALRVALKNVYLPSGTNGKFKLDPASLKVFNVALVRLSHLILHPLVKDLGSATEISLSPDDGLWLVPWNALLLEDGRFAVEQYPIRYLASCRELVAPRSAIPARRPLIVAAPDFDLDPEIARRLTAQVLGRKESADAPKTHVRTVGGTSEPVAAPLPEFAKQPELVSADLLKFAGQKPAIFVGRNALEGVVKAVHHPRVALFATHGYFEPTLGMSAPEQAQRAVLIWMSGKAPLSAAVNPLLHCGILMAGCNRREHSQDEDGILTGMEILGIDFRGTELVVLSACDTGVGEVRIGEGVASVRQAFQLAGAEAVVSSLWPVIVDESTLQVSSFFSHLAAGQTKAQALRSAQLESINRLKKQYGGAPPLHWAAFTVTGR